MVYYYVIMVDQCQMEDNEQYHKCHNSISGINHSEFLWKHLYCVLVDGAYYETDDVYW